MSTDMRDMIVASITELTETANTRAAEIGAATTDRTKLVHDYLNPEGDAADEKISAFIAWRDSALAKIEEEETKAREHITSTYLGEVDETVVDAKKVEYRDLADKIKTARKFYLSTVPGASEEDLANVPDLKTLRGGTAKGGTGSKRPRLQRAAFRVNTSEPWTEVSKASKNSKGDDVTVTNFTVLAGELKSKFGSKVEVKDLQSAAFEAAGTDDLSTLDGKVFEFAVSVGADDKAQTVFVQVQPKADSDE